MIVYYSDLLKLQCPICVQKLQLHESTILSKIIPQEKLKMHKKYFRTKRGGTFQWRIQKFRTGGPAPERGAHPPHIAKQFTYFGSQILSFTNI
jgi:hypothetical protein